jgi:hypothetical protein
MPRVAFDTFAVQVPRGWADITDTVEGDHPPYTLAHRNGVAVVRLSLRTRRNHVHARRPDKRPHRRGPTGSVVGSRKQNAGAAAPKFADAVELSSRWKALTTCGWPKRWLAGIGSAGTGEDVR